MLSSAELKEAIDSRDANRLETKGLLEAHVKKKKAWVIHLAEQRDAREQRMQVHLQTTLAEIDRQSNETLEEIYGLETIIKSLDGVPVDKPQLPTLVGHEFEPNSVIWPEQSEVVKVTRTGGLFSRAKKKVRA